MHPGYWFDAELLSDGTTGVAGFFEAMQPVPTATREMIRWLSSGFEFGEPPSSISLWDRRVVAWPPAGDTRELFVFRYEYRRGRWGEPLRGIGLVGSTTFSLFGASAPAQDATVEDVLAAHCAFEMGR
jgi:hypothetical protein